VAWPLDWVSAPAQLKTFGITFAPSLASTIGLSWEDCLGRSQGAIHAWRERGLPFLRDRTDALETYVFSKLWYMAQILPLRQVVANKATSIPGSFLWTGHLERLAWQELHNPRFAGGLGVSCVTSRGQALLAKQLCLQVAAGGTPAAHLAFWLGRAVGHYVPSVAGGSHSTSPPVSLVRVGEVLVELFAHGTSTPTAWTRLGQPLSTLPSWTPPPQGGVPLAL
jgi:hypothetical protein